MMRTRRYRRWAAAGAGAVIAGGAWIGATSQANTPRPRTVDVWLTTADRGALVARQLESPVLQPAGAGPVNIRVDESQRLQTMDGFGFALTGGSAELLQAMSAPARHAFLQELLGTKPGQAGVSYLRVTIGASDMNRSVYTYDDLPTGETDPQLQRFSLAPDEAAVLPVLREMLAIRPSLTILASPWTAPSWMKTNGLPKDGSLKAELYGVYAQYLVRYLQAMRAAGVPVAALTMQNEPLNEHNTPSMVMTAVEQETFLRDALGPALAASGLHPRVILWDHNCDHPEYPETVLRDPAAARFADGSGFHLYLGQVSAMSAVHDAFPNKNIYFTEQMVIEEKNAAGVQRPVAEPVRRVVIGAVRNWSRNVLLWNLAADPQFGPHTGDGGCPICQGAVTIAGDTVQRNIAYWTVAQMARFVPPGSVRIATEIGDAGSPGLDFVAWRTPGGRRVLLVTNTGVSEQRFTVGAGRQQFAAVLAPGSVGTFTW